MQCNGVKGAAQACVGYPITINKSDLKSPWLTWTGLDSPWALKGWSRQTSRSIKAGSTKQLLTFGCINSPIDQSIKEPRSSAAAKRHGGNPLAYFW